MYEHMHRKVTIQNLDKSLLQKLRIHKWHLNYQCKETFRPLLISLKINRINYSCN